MKSFFRFLLFITLLFSLVVKSFAIDAPNNPEIESFTDTSVTIKWDIKEDALMYYVYYGTESGETSDYENYSDFVEGNSVEITDLIEGTNYYFSVTSLDENGEESIYSDEIIFDVNNIKAEPEVVSKYTDIEFVLEKVSVIGNNKIELLFTNPLDNLDDAIREFKINNKADDFDAFEVINTELNDEDNSVIELTLDRDLDILTEYEVVIVAINSIDGKNIESGIDNTQVFILTEEILEVDIDSNNIDLNAASTKVVVDGDNVDIKTEGADVSTDLEGSSESSLAGTNVDSSELENTTLGAATAQEELPKTGPEHILLLIIAIMLGTVVFVFKFKKA